MAYYCQYEHGGEPTGATRVIMDPQSGDVLSACETHALTLAMSMLTEIVGEVNLQAFLTTWLGSLLPENALDEVEINQTLRPDSGRETGTRVVKGAGRRAAAKKRAPRAASKVTSNGTELKRVETSAPSATS